MTALASAVTATMDRIVDNVARDSDLSDEVPSDHALDGHLLPRKSLSRCMLLTFMLGIVEALMTSVKVE